MTQTASPTPHSLLDSIRGGDHEAWRALLVLYEPLLHRWLRSSDLTSTDREDLTQQILTILVRKLPSFQHSGRTGAFRAWLRSITLRELAEFRRRRAAHPVHCVLDDDAFPSPVNELTQLWEAEYEQHVLSGLLALLEPQFSPSTWRAFRRIALEGAVPRTVALEMNTSINAVTLAKSRVLRRLRQEAHGLLE